MLQSKWVLFTFTTSEAETVATVTENGIRGGLVMENPEEPIVPTITVTDCVAGVCRGDLSGDNKINKVDITQLVSLITNNASAPFWTIQSSNPAYVAEGDVNDDGKINKVDITQLVSFLTNNAAAPFWTVNCP